ncbi:hypothetical protein PORY_001872 [Pneumocystis oryctolagi]|uniref:Uncharacterized protein n=1 Tax=Pneumocystis oryctolagi TaxID=42067 RepID=A0ACB7CHM7_9ASCO|nr:hypothetical protein PORY_001872 [Pneumocystis oryctolagi]
MFGSVANGFANKGSDMDLCVMDDTLESEGEQQRLAKAVVEAVQREGVDAALLLRTRVSIIKVRSRGRRGALEGFPEGLPEGFPEGFPEGLECDIGFNNRLAVYNTQLLATYAGCDGRVREVVLFVKYWAKRRKINDAYRGTLSSAALFDEWGEGAGGAEFAAHECAAGGAAGAVGGFNVWFFKDIDRFRPFSCNTDSLGALVYGFFYYYAYLFNWKEHVVSIRSPAGLLTKREKEWTQAVERVAGSDKVFKDRYILAIEDPFEITHNVGRTVSRQGAYLIRGEFFRASKLSGSQIRKKICEELCEERLVPENQTNQTNQTERGLLRHDRCTAGAAGVASDYVIHFHYDATLKKTLKQFKQLVLRLLEAGLNVECLNGPGNSLLVSVTCPSSRLREISLVSWRKDWLDGVENGLPDVYNNENISPSEKLRLIYYVISSPVSEGGAGIRLDLDEWKMVKSIVPLHDRDFNRNCVYNVLKKGFISESDLDVIRNHFGEKIAMYFFFIRFYLLWLAFPAVFGIFSHFFLPKYSIVYAVIVNLWCIIFVQKLKDMEVKWSIRWKVYGSSKAYRRRKQFVGDKTGIRMVVGKKNALFLLYRRIFRKFFSIVFQTVLSIGLIFVLVGIFFIELYFLEIYDGPFQKYLTKVFVPTILFAVFVPISSILYNKMSIYINYSGNDRKDTDCESVFIHKVFMGNFIICYTILFMISCFYVPFGYRIIPKINIRNIQSIFVNSESMKIKSFVTNPNKLRQQFIYYMITGQVISFFKQWILPFALKFFLSMLRRVYNTRILKFDYKNTNKFHEKADFLSKVLYEMELPEFSLLDNYLELVIQFGYISLFSIIWPLGSVCAFINNMIKIISDYVKLLTITRRSIPSRSDNIGLWSSKLVLLTWLGSLVTSILIYFHKHFSGDKFLVEVFVLVIFADYLYRIAFSICKKITKFAQHEELYILKEEYTLRKAYLQKLVNCASEECGNNSHIQYNFTKVIEIGTSMIINSFEKYKKT